MGLDTRPGRNRHAVHIPQRPVDRVAFHEFESAGGDSGLKNARHGRTGNLGGGKRGQHRKMVAGVRNQAHHNLGDHSQRAFRAYHELGQVVASAVFEGVGSGPDHLTGGQNHLKVEDVG